MFTNKWSKTIFSRIVSWSNEVNASNSTSNFNNITTTITNVNTATGTTEFVTMNNNPNDAIINGTSEYDCNNKKDKEDEEEEGGKGKRLSLLDHLVWIISKIFWIQLILVLYVYK